MANDTVEKPAAVEEGVWIDGPRRGARPGLRIVVSRDQRGRGRPRHGRARGQGRGARRHRLQVGGGHPRRRAHDPPLGQPGRRGRARRGDRCARPHQGGRRRPADPLQEARPLRARLEEDRGRCRVRRGRQRKGHRGRQGRPDPRPRRARLPAGVARRHQTRPGSRRVPRRASSAARSSSSTARGTTSSSPVAPSSRTSARRCGRRSSTG